MLNLEFPLPDITLNVISDVWLLLRPNEYQLICSVIQSEKLKRRAAMPNRKDKITDILAVLAYMKKAIKSASSYRDISELRKDAVQEVSAIELHAGRYKNMDSASKTIHDACARRLRPDIDNISYFDKIVDESLRQNSSKLKVILMTHSKTVEQFKLVNELFK